MNWAINLYRADYVAAMSLSYLHGVACLYRLSWQNGPGVRLSNLKYPTISMAGPSAWHPAPPVQEKWCALNISRQWRAAGLQRAVIHFYFRIDILIKSANCNPPWLMISIYVDSILNKFLVNCTSMNYFRQLYKFSIINQ